MKYTTRISLLLFAIISFTANAQSKINENGFISGDYDALKVSCDKASKSFTIITNYNQGNISCTLFLYGKMIKNKDGKYPIKAYPYGFDNDAFKGTLFFHHGKNGRNGSIEIQLSESGSCQNIIDFKDGAFLPLDRPYPYRKFDMVKSKKAIAYTASSSKSDKKGYLLMRDFVSIISESNGFCYVEYVKKPSFKAWLNKSDLIL